MSTTEMVKDLQGQILTLEDRVASLEAKIAELSKPKSPATSREMTDDDARRILKGDLATAKHKDAADTLGLSYGQVYSCRLEFTFKHIHKEMRDAGETNPWKK